MRSHHLSLSLFSPCFVSVTLFLPLSSYPTGRWTSWDEHTPSMMWSSSSLAKIDHLSLLHAYSLKSRFTKLGGQTKREKSLLLTLLRQRLLLSQNREEWLYCSITVINDCDTSCLTDLVVYLRRGWLREWWWRDAETRNLASHSNWLIFQEEPRFLSHPPESTEINIVSFLVEKQHQQWSSHKIFWADRDSISVFMTLSMFMTASPTNIKLTKFAESTPFHVLYRNLEYSNVFLRRANSRLK